LSADALLSRLNKVRKSGADRWTACCPAHDDRGPSLAIRELEDGRVLLHCFAGCETASVLDAAGLTFDDLFPPRQLGDNLRRERRPFNAGDVLRCLSFEALLIHQCAVSLSNGNRLNEVNQERLLIAVSRFQHGAEVANA
jgi:hypothetical protein